MRIYSSQTRHYFTVNDEDEEAGCENGVRFRGSEVLGVMGQRKIDNKIMVVWRVLELMFFRDGNEIFGF